NTYLSTYSCKAAINLSKSIPTSCASFTQVILGICPWSKLANTLLDIKFAFINLLLQIYHIKKISRETKKSLSGIFSWWTVPDLNRSPCACHAHALPDELTALNAKN